MGLLWDRGVFSGKWTYSVATYPEILKRRVQMISNPIFTRFLKEEMLVQYIEVLYPSLILFADTFIKL